MYRILFLIRSLEIGGAERQLVELIKNMDHNHFDILVVTFYDGGPLRPVIENLPGIRVISLGKKRRWDVFFFFANLLTTIREFNPHIIQSFLDVPNIFNVISGTLLRKKKSLGTSASFVDFSRYDWTAAFVYRLCALLSHFSDKIIANSKAGKDYNIANGYCESKTVVIPNGIDTSVFYPDKLSGIKIRTKWGIEKDELLVGIVGRIDPMKDHPNFLNSTIEVSENFPQCRFVCIGRGNQSYLNQLKDLSVSLLGENRVLWITDCEDSEMPAAFNAMDVLVSSSYGEGLPVVIGEGMACGIPCVVTDVGDSAYAVSDTGYVVPPQDSTLLATAICKLLNMSEMERQKLGMNARHRVLDEFSIQRMASAYEVIFEELAKQ